jgi:hypothetical protein
MFSPLQGSLLVDSPICLYGLALIRGMLPGQCLHRQEEGRKHREVTLYSSLFIAKYILYSTSQVPFEIDI